MKMGTHNTAIACQPSGTLLWGCEDGTNQTCPTRFSSCQTNVRHTGTLILVVPTLDLYLHLSTAATTGFEPIYVVAVFHQANIASDLDVACFFDVNGLEQSVASKYQEIEFELHTQRFMRVVALQLNQSSAHRFSVCSHLQLGISVK